MRITMACLVVLLACGDDDGDPDLGVDAAVDMGRDSAQPDLGFDAGPPPTDEPSKRPWVMQVETDRALVRWETFELLPETVAVEVTPISGGAATTYMGTSRTDEIALEFDNAFVEVPDVAGTYHLHDVVVDGLDAATCYRYALVGFEDHTGRFCTMHEPTDHDTPIVALILGDTSPFLEFSQRLLAETLREPVEFVLHAGDLQYYDALAETWTLWFQEMAPMLEAGAVFPTIGNHEDEIEGEYEAMYARLWDQPSRDGNNSRYHYETGGVHFFSVNSEDDIGEFDADFSWLDEAITAAEATEGYRFSVVYFHRPVYTLGDHAPSLRLRAAIEPVIEAHAVPLVVQGHNHIYERFVVGETTYVVSGGGGSALYSDVNASAEDHPDDVPLRVIGEAWHHAIRMTIRDGNLHGDVIDLEGDLRDSFDITVP